ncbi:hypothetical protein [Embleya scabrispora]|uniref:hypothetical protein n=1 Tax=Embleya scabrispora TaxID=159449 RepID=UPI00131A48FC|nr:hypothetical protein [Embleya scabrispora]MYS86090.1 hypothetical protein [Streptomyces sp. SID5474]
MFTDADPFSDEDFERYERELPGALRTAGDTFPGPSSDLVARGLARGRRRRRLRTLRRSALAAALVTASVAGWATVEGAFDTSDPGPADRTGALWVTNAPRDLVSLLVNAVPSGRQLIDGDTYFAADSPRVLRSQAQVQATYTTTSGSSEISVVVSRPVPGGREDNEAYCAETLSKNACSRSPEPDGGALTVRRTAKEKDGINQLWSALYTRPDGARVDVRVVGTYSEPGGVAGVSGLSMEQIIAIARNTGWESVGAAVPTPAQQVVGLVPALLPPGARVLSADGSWGSDEFVVDTGSGTHRLDVRVEAGPIGERPVCPPAAKDDAKAGTCEIVKLSDGTPARIDRARTENGRYVPWALTAFRARGLRIRFEQDPPSKTDAGDRSSAGPSVIQDQVKVIAASPRWDAP